jgi:serine/threonine-protein phosphatase 5
VTLSHRRVPTKIRYFIVHGGLFSKDDVTLEDVKKIDRFGKQPGQEGLMCEVSCAKGGWHAGGGTCADKVWMAWNSCCGRIHRNCLVEDRPNVYVALRLALFYLHADPLAFPPDHSQGVGVGFGPDVTKRWCTSNEVTAVIRSHEVRQEGYAVEHGGSRVSWSARERTADGSVDPAAADGLCITVFSCPNYCDSTGNRVSLVFLATFPLEPGGPRRRCMRLGNEKERRAD